MGNTYSILASLTAFTDHREYLAQVVVELREQGLFSHRRFNADCGFTSPNFLQLVIQGKRNLSEEAAKKVCQALGLRGDEIRIFLKMMRMNLASSVEERVRLLQDLLKEPEFRKEHRLTEDQLEFYSRWYHIPLRELLISYPLISAKELGARLCPQVPESDIKEALTLMTRLKLVEKKDGRWHVLHDTLSSGNEISSQLLKYFHRQMMELAKESLERFPGEEREISALTLRLSPQDFLRLKEKIREFKREVLAMETPDEGTPVVQFNFQLFPVSQAAEGESK
jgi:uncharacterized protein (TIGR02147 family)